MSPKRGRRKITPRLVILSAPSGAGKTTLCEMLRMDFPGFALSISTTTRPPRTNEKDGIHYHFVSGTTFQEMAKQRKFAEWAKVHDHCYGTPKEPIEKWIRKGRHVLLDIDVLGAMSLLNNYGDRVLLIFILPPSLRILEERLKSRRSDAQHDIETRLQNAYNELEWSKKFDYQITNDDLNRAYRELKKIVKNECL